MLSQCHTLQLSFTIPWIATIYISWHNFRKKLTFANGPRNSSGPESQKGYIPSVADPGGGGGRIGRGPPPPFFRPIFVFFGLFWPIFGRGIEEFGFPAPPFHRSWIRHCFPLESNNISLDSFSNTLNFNHTIHFPGKLTEFQHFNARKSCVLYQHFEKKSACHGRGMPLPTSSPLLATEIVPLPPIVLQFYILGAI